MVNKDFQYESKKMNLFYETMWFIVAVSCVCSQDDDEDVQLDAYIDNIINMTSQVCRSRDLQSPDWSHDTS